MESQDTADVGMMTTLDLTELESGPGTTCGHETNAYSLQNQSNVNTVFNKTNY
jgi:hypothetical protein